MLIKQKKYSEIKDNDAYVNVKSPHHRADWVVGMLLANGYALMDGYYINEVLKVIRTLRELGVEYSMKTIEGNKNGIQMYYEFTTVFFEDDRK